jgi:hypothetical protein
MQVLACLCPEVAQQAGASSEVSRRCGTLPGLSPPGLSLAGASGDASPSRLIVSTRASDSSSNDTTRATDRFVTFSARTSCIT